MEQANLNLLVNKLNQSIKQSAPEIATLGLNVNANDLFVYRNRQIKALTRIESTDSVLIFKDSDTGQICAISGTSKPSSQILTSKTVLSRQTIPTNKVTTNLGFFETFVIRIESPEVDDLHVVDARQFWGVKIKDIQCDGGELQFFLRKEGATDQEIKKGGTIPKDTALVAKVKSVEDRYSDENDPNYMPGAITAIACSMHLEHKSGHIAGWEVVPLLTEEPQSTWGQGIWLIKKIPYDASFVALAVYPNNLFMFTTRVASRLPGGGTLTGPVLDLAPQDGQSDSDSFGVFFPVNREPPAEGGGDEIITQTEIDIPKDGGLLVYFRLRANTPNPDSIPFCAALLLKRKGTSDKIERFNTQMWINGDGDHVIDPGFYSPVEIIWPPDQNPPEPIDPEDSEDPPVPKIEPCIRKKNGEGFTYTPIVFTPETLSFSAAKGDALVVRVEGTQPYRYEWFDYTFWLKRKR